MRSFLRIWSMLVLAISFADARAQPDAEADYAAFTALLGEKAPGTQKELGQEKYLSWVATQRDRIAAAGLAFFEHHTADARRWEVVVSLLGQPRLFIKSYGPDVETSGLAAAEIDEAAKAAWEARGEALRRALLASSDATPVQKERMDWYFFAKDFRATTAAKNKGEKFDYAPFRERFSAHVATYGSLPVVTKIGRAHV